MSMGVFVRRIRRATVISFLLGGLSASSEAQIVKSDFVIELETVATGLTAPVGATHAGDGSGRLFIFEQSGQIRVVSGGTLLAAPFLDISGLLPVLNPFFDERGLLGVAFHPNYALNGRLFVRYSAPRAGAPGEPCFGISRGCHEEILAEFSVSGDPDQANPTGSILFRVDEPQFNHNAGGIAFGPDGFLYFTLGDGGGAHDGLADVPASHGPIGNGQNVDTTLGALLRIDVDGVPAPGLPYAIPGDNPLVLGPGRDEIYAYGFRNPYRFSFDDGPGGSGELLLADVGQNLFEEVNAVVMGGNYGWVIREGFSCFDPFNPTTPPASCSNLGPMGEPLVDPIADYSHVEGGLSVIGGFVYRGSQSPGLVGRYVFGDFSAQFGTPAGRLYFIEESDTMIQEFQIGLADLPYDLFLKGFGEDEDGEIYVCGGSDLGPNGTSGIVHRIVELPGIEIDVKPGSKTNPIHPMSKGVIPVAILGSAAFDVSDVDVSTLAFGPDGAAPVHKKGAHKSDVNHDGFEDLVSHYSTRETGIAVGDTAACLTGEAPSAFEACDSVRTVPVCGLGFELAAFVPWLMWRARRQRASRRTAPRHPWTPGGAAA